MTGSRTAASCAQQVVRWGGLALVLAGCGTTAQYQNVVNPGFGPRELERDTRACEARQQQNTRAEVSVSGFAFISEPNVSSASLQRCLSARGWRRVDQ